MVVLNNKLLLKSMRLCLLRWGWQLAMLVLGTRRSSMFPACKVINKVALAQITTSLVMSETSMAFAQMSIKLMSKGIHWRADIVGMMMSQVLLKAALKKWGREAEESVGKDMKQLHW
jgi:hypothetical protein